jgi:hypothetical protein
MRKIVLMLCVGILMLSLFSCSARPIRRGFQDQVFYSSGRPIMGLQMSADFKYVKNKASSRTGFEEGAGVTSAANITEVAYAFVDQAEKRAVIISLKNIGTPHMAFRPKLFPIKDPFDSGRIEVLGFNYQYCTYAIVHQSQTFLVKGFGRLVGPLNDNILLAHYVERQDEVWNTAMLSDAQKNTLSKFEADCEKDLDLLPDPVIPEKAMFDNPIDLSDEDYNRLKSFAKALIFPRATFSTQRNR